MSPLEDWNRSSTRRCWPHWYIKCRVRGHSSSAIKELKLILVTVSLTTSRWSSLKASNICAPYLIPRLCPPESDKIGGIWANVNKTSGLQLNSLLYRFHPAVRWFHTFPKRDEILGGRFLRLFERGSSESSTLEIRKVWVEYGLEERTRFEVRMQGSWVLRNARVHCM